MGYSVSDAVSEVLAELYFLKYALKNNLVNYSALARFIKPRVVERVGEDVGLDAIVMALRRNAPAVIGDAGAEELNDLVRQCRLRVRDDMVCFHFKRSSELQHALVEMQKSLDWEASQRLYAVQRTEEISVIASQELAPVLDELAKKHKSLLLKKDEGLALITIVLPETGIYTPGSFAFFTSQLETVGVNILSVFSSFTHVSFLVEKESAGAAFDRLTTAIKNASKQA